MTQTLVNESSLLTINRDREDLKKLGFVFEPPLYEIGSFAAAVTDKGFMRVQQDFEKKPLIHDALNSLKGVIRKENRRDETLPIRSTKMAVGSLRLEDGTEYHLERKGLYMLASFLQSRLTNDSYMVKGLTSYLPSIPIHIRDMNYNALVSLLDKNNAGKMMLRVRNGNNIYAVTTTRYRPIDPDYICTALSDVLSDQEGARGEISYDGYRTSIRALWHNYHKIQDSGTGDVFRFGIEVTTSDDRTEACTVNLVAWINQCLNYLIISNSKVNIKSIRHIGEKKDVKQALRNALVQAKNSTSEVVERWNHAAQERVIESSESIREVFTKLIQKGYGKVPGTSTKSLVELYVQNWQKSPGYSRAHIINAMTRTAHTAAWASPWTQREVERQAGNLLYVKRISL